MTLKQKVSSLFILHSPGTDAKSLKSFLDKYQPSGLIFMGDNIPDTSEQLSLLTKELQTNNRLPYLFAVDEEGGVVKRLAGDTYPAAFELKDKDDSLVRMAFLDRTNLLKKVGLNLNFGIVADITDNSDSFIYDRVFGSNPDVVGNKVAAAVVGSIPSTLTTLKHFPGHGEMTADSHSSIPASDMSYEDWLKDAMIPFKEGIKAGANVVMFGHLRYNNIDQKPASLSSKWHDILKNELGFNGITVTDDMGMLQSSGEAAYLNPIQNAIDAINAGNTMLLYVLNNDNSVSGVDIGGIIDGIVAAAKDGQVDIKLINKDVRKVITMRHSLIFN